jgi:hypothetical protein
MFEEVQTNYRVSCLSYFFANHSWQFHDTENKKFATEFHFHMCKLLQRRYVCLCIYGFFNTALQAGRSPVRVPDEVNFFNVPNPSSRTMALRSTQPLKEMSARNLPGGKKRTARRADNLAAICVPNVWKCGSLNLSQPYGFPRPVQWSVYLLPAFNSYLYVLLS